MGKRWVVLALVVVAGCGGSGGDSGRSVEVLEGEAALQAAAVAAVSLSTAMAAILGEPSQGAARAVARAPVAGSGVAGSGLNTASRAIRLPCPQGGTADGDCRESGGRTVVTSSLDRCAVRDPASGEIATATGRLRVTYERAGLCGTSAVPGGFPVTVELRDFVEERRLGPSLLSVVEAEHLIQRFDPVAGGCSVNEGVSDHDGDLRVRRPGVDLEMRLDGLRLNVTSRGSPCTEDVRASGRMDVSDLVRGARFVAAFEELRLFNRRAFDGVAEVALDGTVDFDCVGQVDYSMVDDSIDEALALSSSCPSGGSIRYAVEALGPALARFSLEGIAIDYDDDGVVDFAAAACDGGSLAVCE